MSELTHKPDLDNPGWCICGGEQVYYEGDKNNRWGYGCEITVQVFDSLIQQTWGTLLPPRDWKDRIVLDENYDEIADELFAMGKHHLL